MKLNTWFVEKLGERKEKNLFRELKPETDLVDFCSNDYLGLARSEELFDLINKRTKALPFRRNGSTGSRLISGNSAYTQDVEDILASIFKSEAALILNSGYTANLAVFSSIPQRNDTIILDELAHASIKDGARLSLAKRFTFNHNDLNDLESKLKKASGKIFIAVESIYSMDGDACPLPELTILAKKYGAFIILDEAHSTGVMGAKGSGLATTFRIENEIDIRIYTFGKAMGIHGACIAGSKNLIQYIINFSRPFIYTTALSPHSIASIACAFAYLDKHTHLQTDLTKLINAYLDGLKSLTNRTPSNSAIQTVIFPGNENVKSAANILQQSGFDVRPILSPTIPAGSERLRICLHTYNTLKEITKLTAALKKL
ncbi:pyridoxal phosphate-dependent aminotransferase family protein [Chryseolinea sp. H1M3-3]|uniref:aminotransferase class I/II-fold pyridoxal phosphate-dependent enzyme n=1 Tax=Chryseolinea sp. H1M3-3 TaxID=3034144 RepID=UPI0023ECA678|nr:pyridoxal phosphate-dependent aminotransferase family protein [Chryseolinea sp. H1M3-3]